MIEESSLSAHQAAAALGIGRQTLYAYVSRGLIRSEPAGRGRERRYRAEDVQALLARKAGRRDPQKLAREALHFGAPVLDSAVTLIDGGRLYYRGHDVVELSRSRTLEQVAALIWTGELDGPLPDPGPLRLPERWRALRGAARRPAEAFGLLVPLAALDDPGRHAIDPAAVARAGLRILHLLAASTGGRGSRVAPRLAAAWAPRERAAAPLLEAALVLCADHELNVSAFTARCVASAEATPYAVVTAGLAALQGPRHGGHCDRVEALLDEVRRPARARRVVEDRLRRGEGLPGFGHPLYPDGDPRGAALLERLPRSPARTLAEALAAAALELAGKRPTIDLGLVALGRALDCPPGAALGIFALGRTVGWIGQAIEQYATGQMIRPRARYVGRLPSARRASYP